MPITSAQLESGIARARAAPQGSAWEALLASCGCSAAELGHALSEYHGIATVEHGHGAVPVRDASGKPVAAWVQSGDQHFLVSEDPWSPQVLPHLARYPGAVLAIALPGQLQGWTGAGSAPAPTAASPEAAAPGSPVVAFVDAAIRRACEENASDIHFETDRAGLQLKYRIDGVMSPGERLQGEERAQEVISRIKVMAQLDITERRRPQDGRIHWQRPGGAALDLRVSVMPSIFGEDAVLRLLDRAQLRHAEETISLASLGFPPELAARIRALATRPHGMLLVTGPTGSGKTTTVYAALSESNDGLEKIVTIEDPVEYELPGVLQIPVNEQKGLTFATGLRSILRHDPDKILVGEIRDAETAEIAVQSSLTGHLVMTTVHANSVFDVLGRFQHFGIDPFGLASALNGLVVQRLLRRLCPACRSWRPVSGGEAALLQAQFGAQVEKVPVAVGCTACRGSGYKGRFVVAEIHELDDAQRDLIVRRASLTEMRQVMHGSPADTLPGRAIAQVLAGDTSLEEVRRVVG